MNGACGVRVVNSNTSISAEKIVEKPDFSNLPEINRPVMNPDLGEMDFTDSGAWTPRYTG